MTDDNWQQQQALDQEWLELDGGIEAVCAGLRLRGDYTRAKELEAELRQRLGVQRQSPEIATIELPF